MTDAEYRIEGERVALRPLRRDLAETYARWLNRAQVRVGLFAQRPRRRGAAVCSRPWTA